MLGAFVRFAGAGAVGTLVHYAILLTAAGGFGVAVGWAAAAGAAAGACVNYALAHAYVFTSTQPHVVAMPRFLLIAGVGAVLNGLLVGWLAGFGWHYLLAQVVTTGVLLCMNFAVSRAWIFRSSTSSTKRATTGRSN